MAKLVTSTIYTPGGGLNIRTYHLDASISDKLHGRIVVRTDRSQIFLFANALLLEILQECYINGKDFSALKWQIRKNNFEADKYVQELRPPHNKLVY